MAPGGAGLVVRSAKNTANEWHSAVDMSRPYATISSTRLRNANTFGTGTVTSLWGSPHGERGMIVSRISNVSGYSGYAVCCLGWLRDTQYCIYNTIVSKTRLYIKKYCKYNNHQSQHTPYPNISGYPNSWISNSLLSTR